MVKILQLEFGWLGKFWDSHVDFKKLPLNMYLSCCRPWDWCKAQSVIWRLVSEAFWTNSRQTAGCNSFSNCLVCVYLWKTLCLPQCSRAPLFSWMVTSVVGCFESVLWRGLDPCVALNSSLNWLSLTGNNAIKFLSKTSSNASPKILKLTQHNAPKVM